MSAVAEILDQKQALLQMRRLYLQEEIVGQQVEEVEKVLAILDTDAWTAEDLVEMIDEQDGVARNRLDRLALEMDRHRIVGRDNYTGSGGGLYHGDAFWGGVWKAIHLVGHYLKVHQGRDCLYIRPAPDQAPDAVYRAQAVVTEDVAQRDAVPGAQNQAAVAFELVALLYATFNIRVPARDTTPLWTSLVTYGYTSSINGVVHRPTLECLDVTAPATLEERRAAYLRNSPLPGRPWSNGYPPHPAVNDVHELKPNLRAGIFRVVLTDRAGDENGPRYSWDAQPVMPWRTVLAELVGYTKHAQAWWRERTAEMTYCPLGEMRSLLELEAARLRGRLGELTLERQEVTVTWLKDTLDVDPYVDQLEQMKALSLSEKAPHEAQPSLESATQTCDMQQMLCLLGALGVQRD